eukprot:1158752-Pelagomonas_calceolata.AAC.1
MLCSFCSSDGYPWNETMGRSTFARLTVTPDMELHKTSMTHAMHDMTRFPAGKELKLLASC